MMERRSAPRREVWTDTPVVRLVNAFSSPFDNAIATARTCYSSRIITPNDVNGDEETRSRRDEIARSTYLAGHHTTLQHATFQFVLERVSRQFVWSFLHAHPFYNSEQVSQRYVEVKAGATAMPPFRPDAMGIFRAHVDRQMEAYRTLVAGLIPVVEGEYVLRFPARKRGLKSDPRWKNAVKKKAQEVARYVLPIATHTHLYHTVSGLTLHRYHRLCEQYDVPAETHAVVKAMIAEVNRHDPLFFREIEDPIPLEQTLECQTLSVLGDPDDLKGASRFVDDFDQELEDRTSRLVDAPLQPERTIARAVRTVLGLTEDALSDEGALRAVLDPARNPYWSESLTLSTMSKLTRSLSHAHFVFQKKLSHTADSQDQRHRMIPGSRPILARQLRLSQPDYVTPALIVAAGPDIEAQYRAIMHATWATIEQLLRHEAPLEFVLYLLPNAFPIRFVESGDLLHFHHKWTTRLCYTAQEEIWNACLDEVHQVRARTPGLVEFVAAPCALRLRAGVRPICPEGDRFCGVKVWGLGLSDYRRVI